jgi:hypothetical protein
LCGNVLYLSWELSLDKHIFIMMSNRDLIKLNIYASLCVPYMTDIS